MNETNADTILGKMVVENHLCTSGEVDECFKLMKNLAKKEDPRSLAEVLIARKYITNSQLNRAKSIIDDSRPAQKIPGFQIIEKLGAGAMATVFLAKQISLDRLVAIKVLPKRLSENQEYVERFYKEGQAAAKLNHKNIVQAIDVGESGGYYYFVMEYVKGKIVYDDLAEGVPYSETDALDIIIQIGEALEHAHEKGLVHRDVKPKNVMITEDGIAKLADMGLAREVEDQEAAKSEAGRAYGTPYYIAPEQIRGEVDIDYRVDIYSLGAMLYHMTTGRVPFEAPTPSAVMHKHLKDPLIPPDHINSELSVGLAEVIEVMMAKNRDDRYQCIKLLLDDLRAIKAGESPLHARQGFDPSILSDLENGEYSDEDLEDTLENNRQQLGFKMAIIILSGMLAVATLIIIMLASK